MLFDVPPGIKVIEDEGTERRTVHETVAGLDRNRNHSWSKRKRLMVHWLMNTLDGRKGSASLDLNGKGQQVLLSISVILIGDHSKAHSRLRAIVL